MHHGTIYIGLFVVISNVVALSSAALMIDSKLIWLTCQMLKFSMTVTRSCWLLLKNFLCMSWAAEEQNRQGYCQSLCKNSTQKRDEDVVLCKRTVVSSFPTSFFKIHFFNGTKSRNKIFHHRANDQNAFVSNLAILHIQRQRKIRRRASRFSRSYNATFHRSIKRSDHRWLSHNQPAIVQQIGQAHCSL